MSEIFEYSFPTRIIFGPGARKRIPLELSALDSKRPIVVTDRGISALPISSEIESLCGENGRAAALFDGVEGNPVLSQVTAGVDAYQNHDADCIVALGGGAAVDVAKAIAVKVNHKRGLFEYEDRPGALPIDGEVPPIIGIPTTAGTGSEVGRSTVISEDDTHIKRIIFSPRILPWPVIADPELLLGLPATITAATGMDALTHLVEARIARGFQPLCDGIAMEGLRFVAGSLRECFEFAKAKTGATPEHIEARGRMLNASMMGAIAFQKGLGVTHSLAHSLSTVHDMHHGLANGIMISYAMRFNLESVSDVFAEMAHAVGAKQRNAAGFVDWIDELKSDLELPQGLKSAGLTGDRLNDLVRYAELDGCHTLNPRSVTTADFEVMYRDALAS